MASHIDYPGFGNHDIGTSSGEPSEQNFAVPVPVTGVDSPVAPPSTERAEHNFSWDYGDVHFVTFDTNSYTDPTRRAALISYFIADLNPSNARWKIVYGHHPIASALEKETEWNSTAGRSYYDDAVSRFTTAGVDLFLVGHSHTFSWTHPLTDRASEQWRDRSRQRRLRLVCNWNGIGAGGRRHGRGRTSSRQPLELSLRRCSMDDE